MNQEIINKEAAKSLLNRAMEVDTQSRANFLIDTAGTLDSNIDTKAVKSMWLEQWLIQNKSRISTISVTL